MKSVRHVFKSPVLLGLILALFLVACGSSAPGPSSEVKGSASEQSSTAQPAVGTAAATVVGQSANGSGSSSSGGQKEAAPEVSPTDTAPSSTGETTPGKAAKSNAASGSPLVDPAATVVTPKTAQASALETTPVPTPDDGYTGPVGGNVGDRAAEIEGIKAWLNSEPLTLAGLRGKVVLVDFWTYTCINCIRTYPFLKLWNSRYADDGLVIIGVHSPEFEFEKDQDNVIRATQDDGII